MIIREVRLDREDFERCFQAYHSGFPDGHNRYSFSRLFRTQHKTIFVVEDGDKIVGIVIGVCNATKEVWMMSLTVSQEQQYQLTKLSLNLLLALGIRLKELGYKEVYVTTSRRSIKWLAEYLGAVLVEQNDNFYFDGQTKWVFKVSLESPEKLIRMLRK